MVQSVPLVIGQFHEMIDANHAIVASTTGSNYFVRCLSTIDREQLKPNSSVRWLGARRAELAARWPCTGIRIL